jgi:hypothetical protein
MDPAAPPKSLLGLVPSLQTPGFRQVDAGELAALFQYMWSTAAVRGNGATAVTATQLQGGVNEVIDVANGAAVKLPSALPGGMVWVINGTTTALAIFASAPDQIVGNAVNVLTASVALASSATTVFICTRSGHWKQVLGV